MFFRVQVFEGSDFRGSRFLKVQVQGLGPGFRSSNLQEHIKIWLQRGFELFSIKLIWRKMWSINHKIKQRCKKRYQWQNYLRKFQRYNIRQFFFGTLVLVLSCCCRDNVKNWLFQNACFKVSNNIVADKNLGLAIHFYKQKSFPVITWMKNIHWIKLYK